MRQHPGDRLVRDPVELEPPRKPRDRTRRRAAVLLQKDAGRPDVGSGRAVVAAHELGDEDVRVGLRILEETPREIELQLVHVVHLDPLPSGRIDHLVLEEVVGRAAIGVVPHLVGDVELARKRPSEGRRPVGHAVVGHHEQTGRRVLPAKRHLANVLVLRVADRTGEIGGRERDSDQHVVRRLHAPFRRILRVEVGREAEHEVRMLLADLRRDGVDEPDLLSRKPVLRDLRKARVALAVVPVVIHVERVDHRLGKPLIVSLGVSLRDRFLHEPHEKRHELRIREAELTGVDAADALALLLAIGIPFGMLLAVLLERQVAVPRMREARRTELHAATVLERHPRRTVRVEPQTRRRERIRPLAELPVDVTPAEVRASAAVQRRERERLRLRDVLVAFVPPVDPAVVLEEVVHGVERTARAAAVEDDVAAERLHAPFLVLERGRGEPLRLREVRIADVERDRVLVLDRDASAGGDAVQVVREFPEGRPLPDLGTLRSDGRIRSGLGLVERRIEHLSVGEEPRPERGVGDVLHRAIRGERLRRRRGRRLAEREEDRFHADRAERHVRRREADGHEQVRAFAALWHERAVADRIGTDPSAVAERPVFDVPLVADTSLAVGIPPAVVRIHAVGAERDGGWRRPLPEALVLGHHVGADHAARLADVELVLPAVPALAGELVPARPPARHLAADALRDARMVRERPHQPPLVPEVRRGDPLALGVGGLRIGGATADQVRRKARAVVRVRLAVRHLRIDPRQAVAIERTRLQVAQEHLVIELAVTVRLRERDAVLRIVREAHPKAVGLDAVVARAVRTRILGLDARQESARRIPLPDVGIDPVLHLVIDGQPPLDAVDRLAVDLVRLAPDRIGHARRGHQVPLVGAVEEYPAAVRVAAQRPDGLDSPVFDFDSELRLTVEIFAAANVETVSLLPAFENRERRGRLERPHRVGALRAGALAVRTVVGERLPRPVLRIGIPRPHVAVELARDATEGLLAPDVGLAEPAGRQPPDPPRRFDQDRPEPHPLRLHRRGDPRRGRPVDHQVVLRSDRRRRTAAKRRDSRKEEKETRLHAWNCTTTAGRANPFRSQKKEHSGTVRASRRPSPPRSS